MSCWSFPNAAVYISFPGKVIGNLWFVNLSCLRTQLLVRVPNFSCIIFLKNEIERCEQSSNRRGKLPLDLQSNALTTRLTQFEGSICNLFWSKLVSSVVIFSLAPIFEFLLMIVGLVVSNRWDLHVFSKKWKRETLVRQSQLFAKKCLHGKFQRCVSCSRLHGNLSFD